MTSVQQLKKQQAAYHEIVTELLSLPYPIGEMPIATACESIGLVLSEVYSMMDDKRPIDDNQVADLINFIRRNYGALHPVEVKLAYEMHLAGKLHVDFMGTALNNKNIARLLNAYVIYRNRCLTKNTPQEPSKQKLSPSPKELREQHIEFLKTVIMFYKKFLEGKHMAMDYLYSATYDLLVKHEIIERETVPEIQEQAMTLFRTRLLSQRNVVVAPQGKELVEKSKPEYKELMVNKAFQKMQFDEFDLEEFLMSKVR